MKTFFFAVQLVLAIGTANANTMFILVSGNVTDESAIIRQASKADINDVTDLFQQIAKTINYKTKVIQFANDNENRRLPFTSGDILREIDNLNIFQNDIVVFYCHTHGWKTNDNFPQLSMGTNKKEFLKVSTIRKRIKAKKARLSLIMTHACNGGDDSNPMNSIGRNNFRGVDFSLTQPLFLSLRGDITITSSHKNYVSRSASTGAISTTYIINNLIKMANGEIQNVSWHNLINISCDEISGHFGSTPLYEINLNNNVKVNSDINVYKDKWRISSANQGVSLKKQDSRLYAKNLSDKPIVVLIAYQNTDGHLKSTRVARINPNRGLYLRNNDFTHVNVNKQNNVLIYFKEINRKDPLHKIIWQGGRTVTVNDNVAPMTQLKL